MMEDDGATVVLKVLDRQTLWILTPQIGTLTSFSKSSMLSYINYYDYQEAKEKLRPLVYPLSNRI